jgi:hypothetical protein
MSTDKLYNSIIPILIAGGSIFTRIYLWISELPINSIIITMTSVGSLIYIFMKIYDQYIITKKRKLDKLNE